jgi:hypothetical protein
MLLEWITGIVLFGILFYLFRFNRIEIYPVACISFISKWGTVLQSCLLIGIPLFGVALIDKKGAVLQDNYRFHSLFRSCIILPLLIGITVLIGWMSRSTWQILWDISAGVCLLATLRISISSLNRRINVFIMILELITGIALFGILFYLFRFNKLEIYTTAYNNLSPAIRENPIVLGIINFFTDLLKKITNKG